MALARSEREKFLAEPHVAALSVDAGPDRGPLSVPIWYQYAPGGDPWILTAAEQARAYVEMAVAEFGPQRIIRLRPEHWLSADLGPG